MSSLLTGVVLGPFALPRALPKLAALAALLLLTLLTQVGGVLLWPLLGASARAWSQGQRARAAALVVGGYLVLGVGVLPLVAARTGRVRLPLVATQATPVGPRSLGYVLLLRNYARPHARDALLAAARKTAEAHPGTVVRYLDAAFPFPVVPMLPHLSHVDGERIDLAFLHTSADGDPVDGTPSPIGYWGYAEPAGAGEERAFRARADACRGSGRRWDLDALQPLWPELPLDRTRTRALLRALAGQKRVSSLLLEPTLHGALSAPKLQANPCNVARHDDHVHVTVR
jgi:hypothetical protein